MSDVIRIHREEPIPPKALRVELWRDGSLVAQFLPKSGHVGGGFRESLPSGFLSVCAEERKRWEDET